MHRQISPISYRPANAKCFVYFVSSELCKILFIIIMCLKTITMFGLWHNMLISWVSVFIENFSMSEQIDCFSFPGLETKLQFPRFSVISRMYPEYIHN